MTWTGNIQHEALAGAVTLYLIAPIRGSHVSESLVRDGIILKYKATATQQVLRIAHEKSSAYAAEMQHQATHDGLTHLLSRRGFMQVAERMQAERTTPLCMLFLDLMVLRHAPPATRLPRVKIDRCFVQQLALFKENQADVHAFLHLGQASQFQVIAECVENREELHMLQQLNCLSAQGYYFARPMREQDALAFIKRYPG